MKKETKPKPYIDYKTARVLSLMYDFVTNAKYERDLVIKELERQITFLHMTITNLETVSDDPDNWGQALDKWGFKDNIARLRNTAWNAGLTSTLFEKLKDKKFRDRFNGWGGLPVLKEEIEDHYDEQEL